MRILPKPLKVLALTVGTGVTAASLLATSDAPAGEAFVFGTPKSVLACYCFRCASSGRSQSWRLPRTWRVLKPQAG